MKQLRETKRAEKKARGHSETGGGTECEKCAAWSMLDTCE